ncbi:hypothetical protein [Falsibacillus albus]|uniref:Uncharacterized protein n=1 Tax=Falsibacillus albus TaxID=2478915 RepID=A0A3L7K907_9BACI|nr:hypothetical protein [Falsibacillus albus]RLQ97132.1 hypothetical protein D9X91_02970 [Falsibacillus albus]
MEESMENLIENAVKKYVQDYFQNEEGEGKTNLYEGQSVVHVDNGNLPIVLLYLFMNQQKQSSAVSIPKTSNQMEIVQALDELMKDQKEKLEGLLKEMLPSDKKGS